MRCLALALFSVISLTGAARADVLHVPKDFATIQAAIDAAQAGDEIVIAAGSYAESLLIDGKSDLSLRGKGQVTLTGTPGLSIQEGADIEVERLRFEGSTGTGVAISGFSSGVTLLHCRVSDSDGTGIAVEQSDTILLEHVQVSGAGLDGLHATLTNFITVAHCTFTDVVNYGIDIDGGTGHLVEHVKVAGTGEDGISLAGTGVEGSIVRKNKVSDVGLAGISVRGDGVLVENNRVLPPSTIGVWLLDGTCIARKNRLIEPDFYGVDIFSGAHQVLDNRIVQPGETGIRVVGVAGVPAQVLADNRVLKSVGNGILLGEGSDGCTLVDNRVAAPAGDGVFILAAGAQLVANRVTGAAEDGLHLEGGGSLVVGNRAKGSTAFDLNDTSDNGNTYVDNDFGTTHFD
jgi:Right handed beta helix region